MRYEEWHLDKSSPVPLHRQIYEYMQGKIMNGEWPVGTRIPPQRELAARFQVNRSTVVYALGELAANGLIESKVGQGTVVVNNTWNLLAAGPAPDWNRYVRAGAYPPNIQLIQRINQAEARADIIRLGTGELSPELLPAAHMQEVIGKGRGRHLSLGYSEPKGSRFLRETLSEYLRSKGIFASPSSILIVSGALQGLQLISVGLLQPGSTVLTETPSYLNSIHVFQSAGIRLAGVPMDLEGIRPDAVGPAKRQHQAGLLYTIPSFHNPTGRVMSGKRREELMKAAALERLPVIEDDVYGDLWMDAPPPPPLKSADSQGLVLYMGSMSKTLGPGLRIGWVAGPEPVIDRLADIKMQTDYGASSLSQYAVAEWLSTGRYEPHLADIRQKLKLRRDFALSILQQYFQDMATWEIPGGGFYIWLRLHVPIPVHQLFEQALKEGILLNPGQIYDRHDRQHLRLSYAYASLHDLERGLIRLAGMIRAYR
ncbi:aminotransferase-like domain-containing protein [Paenibacillus cineris]|uniref:aminotransferase-like domain-containing protein n=1 Tax=Paenibacillus cineris TaxID=237530 RepID=UPI001B0A599C|nr:PLP-dependent aminotransferase family protein [Paenibacillus cineris]GIO62401.1 putative HTH-type transcriptional regulator YisV [Paenibacillus cineris]